MFRSTGNTLSPRGPAAAGLVMCMLGMLVAAAAGQDPDEVMLLPAINAAQGDVVMQPGVASQAPIEAETIPAEEPKISPENAVAEEVLLDAAPRVWYQPGTWFGPIPWDAGVELGINGSEGNAQTLSLNLGANAQRKTEVDTISLLLNYVKTNADSIETQNNAYFKGNYDRGLGESRWSLFGKGTVEYDDFRAFDLRLAGNGGFGYRLIHWEGTSLVGRFGAGVSHEIGSADDRVVPEANYGADFEHQITKRQKVAVQIDYYPSWEDYADYRAEGNAGWEILLDEQSHMSLKLAAIDRYDSTPGGKRPNDLNYSLLLVWKL